MGNEEKGQSSGRRGVGTRLFAFTALGALVACTGYVGQQGYLAATDSFIAPIILSPDNDQVLASKLHASQLAVERARTATEIEAVEEALAAGQKAIERLKGLQRTPASSLAWTSAVSTRQFAASVRERKMLQDQHALLADMAEKQSRLVEDRQTNLEAGLISKTELTKELQTQNQLHLAMLENERTRLQTNLQVDHAMLTRQSISGEGPMMPEVMVREEQMVRIELEIMKLESEQRSKRHEKKLLSEKLATLDEVESQLKTRPIFRAAEKSMDVAFVPYTQSAGVTPGATVFECVWGAFHCKPVGEVSELVPGEVILPDPWGNQARGQYAVLDLTRRDAAKSKTLRIRANDSPSVPSRYEPGERVSAK